MTLPDDFIFLGVYEDFELYQKFVPEAQYSDRAIVYVCAKKKGAESIAFTQTATIHRRDVEDRTEQDIERRLTIDALSRAKHRIMEKSYEEGQAYTIQLDEFDME